MAQKSVKRYIGGDEAGAGVLNKKKLSSAVPGAEYQDKVEVKDSTILSLADQKRLERYLLKTGTSRVL